MNTSHTNLKYVHVNSKHRYKGESRSRFNVAIPHGFNHCTKVCLKNLSIANTMSNTNNLKIQWAQLHNNGQVGTPLWNIAIFEGIIPVEELKSYMDNNEINGMMQKMFTNSSGFQIKKVAYYDSGFNNVPITGQFDEKVDSETIILLKTIQYNTDTFKFEISGGEQSGGAGHIISIFRDEEDLKNTSIWEHLGWNRSDIPVLSDIKALQKQLRDRIYDVSGKFNGTLFNKDNYVAKNYKGGQKIIQSLTIPVSENHVKYINVCSDMLGQDGYVMREGRAIRTNILETIPNVSSKFSFLHHSNETLSFHDLKGSILTHFDLILLDENMNEFDPDGIDDWKAVIVFQEVQQIVKTQEEIQRFNDIAYALGHPTR